MTAKLGRDLYRLHLGEGLFVLPNAWDVGSARLLEVIGSPAVATTSSGHAASLGRADQKVLLDELLDLVQGITEVLTVPLTVDAESCFGETLDDVAETVVMLAEAGAAGLSIEDYDPVERRIVPIRSAIERVATASQAADQHGMMLTVRAENHLYLADEVEPGRLLDDTVLRLSSYVTAGGDVAFAPGLTDVTQIARVVREVSAPVNVLLMRGGPSVAELREAGVRRASTGGALTWVAYQAMVEAALALGAGADLGYLERGLDPELRRRAFGG